MRRGRVELAVGVFGQGLTARGVVECLARSVVEIVDAASEPAGRGFQIIQGFGLAHACSEEWNKA